MLTCVIYVKGNEASETAVAKTVASLECKKWDYALVEGVTAKTINHDEFPFPVLKGSRLESFQLNKSKEEHSLGVKDFCFLNMDGAFFPPSALNKPHLRAWYQQHPHKLGIQDFPYNYPLRYYKESIYYGSAITPGTSAYILTVSGAKKLLKSAEIGLEQSDFIINSNVMELQYLYPSPVKFQKVNPNLSHIL